MPFDTTKPADRSPIVAAEVRDRFNTLQEQITALQNQLGFNSPILQANSVKMSLDWIYTGKNPEEFLIFGNQSNQAGEFFDQVGHVAGNVRTWATDFDDPADAAGHKYYIVAVDPNDAPLAPPSNTVGWGT